MVFVLGVVLLGAGILVLRILSPMSGNQPAFMKRPGAPTAAIFVVQALILGGLGLLIGGAANWATG